MKKAARILKFFGILFVVILVGSVIYLKSQDDVIEPEALTYLALKAEEEKTIQDFTQWVRAVPLTEADETILKSTPCNRSVVDQDDFVQKWKDFSTNSKLQETVFQPLQSLASISVALPELSQVMGQVGTLRRVFMAIRAEICYLEVTKSKDLEKKKEAVAQLLLRSMESPNIILAQLLIIGELLSVSDSIKNKKSVTLEMVQEFFHKQKADTIFWSSYRHDAIVVVASFASSLQQSPWEERLVMAFFPLNKFKNQMWRSAQKKEMPFDEPPEVEGIAAYLPGAALHIYNSMFYSRMQNSHQRLKNKWEQATLPPGAED